MLDLLVYWMMLQLTAIPASEMFFILEELVRKALSVTHPFA